MKWVNFFSELKRCNVYKVAITYAVVAWLLVQAASIPAKIALAVNMNRAQRGSKDRQALVRCAPER